MIEPFGEIRDTGWIGGRSAIRNGLPWRIGRMVTLQAGGRAAAKEMWCCGGQGKRAFRKKRLRRLKHFRRSRLVIKCAL